MSYRLKPLDESHDPASFDCGSDALNEWLQRHAMNARGQGTRTYVLIEKAAGEVVGYFALAPHMVARDQAPRRIGRGAPRQIPAILLAKLALDERVQGRGLGSELLIRALRLIVEAGRVAGGRLVVVDSIDEQAAAFYVRHDFEPVPGNPARLVKKLSTVAKALGEPWP